MRGRVMRVQRWGRRDWTVFALIAVASVVAVPGVLAAVGVKDSWWAALAVAGAGVAGVFAKVWAERYQRMATRRDEGELSVLEGCLVTARGHLPTVRQLDPRQLGVHPAARVATPGNAPEAAETMPVYVPRDADEQVRARIARGGFVLLVGDSTAGKSRMAYEAVAATVPDRVVIAPQDRAAVRAGLDRALRLGDCVVWLNDLEHYLGAEGLTRQMVARVLSGARQTVVVATIRAVELARFTDESSTDDAARQGFRAAREVLELVDDEVRIERSLSAAERQRAQERDWDPRIADAVRHSGDYGLAEYLAAGPELLRDWRNGWDVGAHPRGAALVAAAVDVRRAGLEPPLPGRLLEELAGQYLVRRGGDRLRPEPAGTAWEWALRARRATTTLMTGSANTGYDVFDYLVDTLQRENTPETFVPESVLRAAVDYADGPEAMSIGSTAYSQGHYATALHAWSAATRWSIDHAGPEHPQTLTSRAGLAATLRRLGRWEEAEREHRAVLDIRTRVLGPEHPDTLTSRAGLAVTLRGLGRWEEGEREGRAVLESFTRVLGPDHPHTLAGRSYVALAVTLRGLGRWEEAERELRAVLDIFTRVLGPEHPDTLTSRAGLAVTLRGLGRSEEAEREGRAVLDSFTRVLGPEHPHTLTSRAGLAATLRRLGRWEEAEREHRAVLDIRTRVLGPEHPDTLTSRDNLALLLQRLGRVQEAEREHRAVLDIRTRVLGPEHPDTLTSRDNLTAVRSLRSKSPERP
ncbi:tetratricopeptide repeat protein [Amycolatopsis sp. cmx-4-68]|uniref:tetratricopeptide repeat protein n=1 Tax=Amycolatopsis sp. cmx-4-68 TaxID=2790938 RepID=UPI00397CF67D